MSESIQLKLSGATLDEARNGRAAQAAATSVRTLELSGEVFTLDLNFQAIRLAEPLLNRTIMESISHSRFDYTDMAILFCYATGGPGARFADVDACGDFIMGGGHIYEVALELIMILVGQRPLKADDDGDPT